MTSDVEPVVSPELSATPLKQKRRAGVAVPAASCLVRIWLGWALHLTCLLSLVDDACG